MSEERFTLDDEENGLCRCILVDGEEIPTCEICDLLNKLYEENRKLQKDLYIVQTDCKNAKESKEHWRNKAKELEEKNKQIGFLKRDLYTIIRDTKETPFGNSITMTKIRERWE